MYILATVIPYLFPLIALILLIIGMRRNKIYYVISSLWLCLISLLIQFQFAGNQIFSSYFNFTNTAIYSLSLLILLTALIRIITHLCIIKPIFKYTHSMINAFLVVGTLLILTNLWINAFFIEQVKNGIPVIQIALLDKPTYCQYKNIYYKVAPDNSVMYLCPNHFGLIASIGSLDASPDFVMQQLHSPIKKTQ